MSKTIYSFRHKHTGNIRNIRLDEIDESRDIRDEDDPQANAERWDVRTENRRNYRRLARDMKQRGYLSMD